METGRFPAIDKARAFSSKEVNALREKLKTEFNGRANFSVVINGSFARREASARSDIDFYFLHDGEPLSADTIKAVKDVLFSGPFQPPSTGGAFGEIETQENVLSNIGGEGDDNNKITRRMLTLLEGDWLFNQEFFTDFRRKILERYVQPNMSDHQLTLFLINDIIRYYRTVCVDYEFKTVEQSKPWAIRNVKLIFSRKLMYFSGIVAVAETAQRRRDDKLTRLSRLLCMPPIERIVSVCGSKADRALSIYDFFLCEFEKEEVREALEHLPEGNGRRNELFRDLKNQGHHFSWALMSLLHETYGPTHPIHKAIVF